MIDLDKLDIKILTELQRDASLTNVELAARVNLSPSPCLARVRMLKQSGLISKHVTLLDPRRLGLNVNVFIQITLEKQTRATGLDMRPVAAHRAALTCHRRILVGLRGDIGMRTAHHALPPTVEWPRPEASI